MSKIIYPAGADCIIDVTKPPFSAVPDGKTDCTRALSDAIDLVLSQYKSAFLNSCQKLSMTEDDNALISFEIRKVEGKMNVPFPEVLPKNYIIYLPKGTYLVSDTISYSDEFLYNVLFNIRWLEMNALIRIVGEDRDETVIKLQNGATGFEFGARKPVVSFMKGEKSGVAMSNLLKNLTVDIGEDNPGAVGVRFFSNNSGQVRDVKIISSDKNGRGYAGLEIIDEKVSCPLITDVEIEGFDYAIRFTAQQYDVTLEHIKIKNQNICGIYNKGGVMSVRDLVSENEVAAVVSLGFTSQLVMVDSLLDGGSPDHGGINAEYGYCYLRNVTIRGYNVPLKTYFGVVGYDEFGYECSTNKKEALWEDIPAPEFFDTSDMPTPPEFDCDYKNYISVKDFGAVGDGLTDDTKAIQKALDSADYGVYFESGIYFISKPITVGSNVKALDFMFCDLRFDYSLATNENTGIFRIEGEGEPLKLCNLMAWEQAHGVAPIFEDYSSRTLYMNMLHAQASPMYRAKKGGNTLFIESVACTVGGVPGAGIRKEKVTSENSFIDARHIPCFGFLNQQVYARQIDPERADVEILNKGGKLIVLGYKTEEEGTAFKTVGGGTTIVLGGFSCIGGNKEVPVVLNEDSHSFIAISTMITNDKQLFPLAVTDTRKGETRILKDEALPKRAMLSYILNPYVG